MRPIIALTVFVSQATCSHNLRGLLRFLLCSCRASIGVCGDGGVVLAELHMVQLGVLLCQQLIRGCVDSAVQETSMSVVRVAAVL